MTTQTYPNIFNDIWTSFRALPGWVQVWMALVLAPVNMASLLFINQPMGVWVALLANIPLMLNMGALIKDRGFSALTAVTHIVPWTILVVLILFARPDAAGNLAGDYFARPAVTEDFNRYLSVLLVADIVSLLFDYREAPRWLGGDRRVAGR